MSGDVELREPDRSAKMASHAHCVMCGHENPNSLHLRFEPSDDGGVHGAFDCRDTLQGYQGIVHGGMIAAMLDSAMAHCLFDRGIAAVTADLRVRYLHPLPCDARVVLAARVVQSRAPLYRMTAEASVDGKVIARASASFLDPARRIVPNRRRGEP